MLRQVWLRFPGRIARMRVYRPQWEPYSPRVATNAVPRRLYSGIYEEPQRRRSPWIYIAIAACIGSYGYWKYITYHRYPESVAKKLKEGLMAEINGAGFRKSDHNKALTAYLEALNEADDVGVSPLSDEYTGIQLKIAEMYERLDMIQEALCMYMEISNMYLLALRSQKIPEKYRDHVIQRDLKIALISGLYMSTQPRLAMKMLLPHIMTAQREAAQRDPELARLLLKGPDKKFVEAMQNVNGQSIKLSSKFEPAWGIYCPELFALREMYAGLCLATGDYMQATLFKQQTTELMVLSGFPVGDCLLSMINCASLSLLRASVFSDAQKLTEDENVVKETDSAHPSAPASQPSDLSVHTSEHGPIDVIQVEAKNSDKQFLTIAENIYNNVANMTQSLSVLSRRGGLVPQAYAMAIYGQGIVAFRENNMPRAAELLREARVRARGLQAEALLESVSAELQEIDRLAAGEKSAESISPEDLPKIDVMFWKMEPEDWALTPKDIGDSPTPQRF